MTAQTISKRIQPNATGYDCYLNTTHVGTAATYGAAEQVCIRAYEQMSIEAAPVAQPSAPVRVEHTVCTEERDIAHNGKIMGTSYFAGDIEIYVPIPTSNPADVPELYFADCHVRLDVFERELPNILAAIAAARTA